MKLPVAVLAALLSLDSGAGGGAAPVPPLQPGADSDCDGVPDDLEQALLERFAPTFMISTTECDGVPAEFQPGLQEPRVAARNGTLYGQAFTLKPARLSGSLLELHFYHLWGRDCGRASHALDVEHVSALVRAGTPDARVDEWRALYWYAAAHEGTPCEASNGASAAGIGAEECGATVWVSRGKHASFLNPELCRSGCRIDRCDQATPLSWNKLINIGEPGAPMNGARWTMSRRWSLREKLNSDFTAAILARLEERPLPGAGNVAGAAPPTKALILTGNSLYTAVQAGAQETEGGLDETRTRTGSAVGKTLTHTGRSLVRALRAIGRALDP